LYQAYRNYSIDTNEYVRSTADFYFALEKLRIREDNGAEEDFLQ
jgi:putative DNA primase/helicase